MDKGMKLFSVKYNMLLATLFILVLTAINPFILQKLKLTSFSEYSGFTPYFYYLINIHILILIAGMIYYILKKNYKNSFKLFIIAFIYGILSYGIIFLNIIVMGAYYK
jgi:hypothetical protein